MDSEHAGTGNNCTSERTPAKKINFGRAETGYGIGVGVEIGAQPRNTKDAIMRILAVFLCAMLLSAVTLDIGAAPTPASGYIQDMSGEVRLGFDKRDMREAHKNDPLQPGMTVVTGADGSAVLKFADGETVALTRSTTFFVQEYLFDPQKPAEGRSVFSLLQGGLRFVTGLLGRSNPSAFKLKTRSVTMGIRGTDATVYQSDDDDGDVCIQVNDGNVTVTEGDNEYETDAGQIICLLGGVVQFVEAVPSGMSEVFANLNALQISFEGAGALGQGLGGAGGAGAAGAAGSTATGLAIGAAFLGGAAIINNNNDGGGGEESMSDE